MDKKQILLNPVGLWVFTSALEFLIIDGKCDTQFRTRIGLAKEDKENTEKQKKIVINYEKKTGELCDIQLLYGGECWTPLSPQR